MPSAEDYYEAKYHFQGCIPDFPEPRTWGCCNCDAAFWKNVRGAEERSSEGCLIALIKQTPHYPYRRLSVYRASTRE